MFNTESKAYSIQDCVHDSVQDSVHESVYDSFETELKALF